MKKPRPDLGRKLSYSDNVQITLNVAPELRDQLKAKADSNCRRLTEECRFRLMQSLEAEVKI